MHRNLHTEPPHAIVIGLDSVTGLQTARILARHAVPVIGVAHDPAHHCCRTKACERIVFADTSGEGLIRALAKMGPALKEKAVLFPCTDTSVLLISRRRRELEAWYHVMLPEADVVEMLMDKIRFHRYAESQGLPVPRTHFLYSRADAERAVEELAFPCILKPPMKTPTWETYSPAKVYRVVRAAELLDLYDRCSAWSEVLMAQEWIEGSDAHLYSCNCYFDASARPLVTFVSRKLRQWPPGTGTSCLGEECRNDIVLQETVRLFRSAGYQGLGYVEMKRDERTGAHFVIEANVGRPTGRSAIAEAGGVELLYAAYCDRVGKPLPENLEQTYQGAKWIYLRRDLQSTLYYWRRGELTLKDWWRSLRGLKGDALFSWSDPAPFWGDLRRGIQQIRSKKKAGAWQVSEHARSG